MITPPKSCTQLKVRCLARESEVAPRLPVRGQRREFQTGPLQSMGSCRMGLCPIHRKVSRILETNQIVLKWVLYASPIRRYGGYPRNDNAKLVVFFDQTKSTGMCAGTRQRCSAHVLALPMLIRIRSSDDGVNTASPSSLGLAFQNK